MQKQRQKYIPCQSIHIHFVLVKNRNQHLWQMIDKLNFKFRIQRNNRVSLIFSTRNGIFLRFPEFSIPFCARYIYWQHKQSFRHQAEYWAGTSGVPRLEIRIFFHGSWNSFCHAFFPVQRVLFSQFRDILPAYFFSKNSSFVVPNWAINESLA